MASKAFIIFVLLLAFVLFFRKYIFPTTKSLWAAIIGAPMAGVIAMLSFVYGDLYKLPEGKFYAFLIFAVGLVLCTKLVHKILGK